MSGEPKWRQVLEDLEHRLAEGDIEDRFPTDRELVEHYGVSRHTVREAVRHLRARGIIQRERGRGSTVRVHEFAPPAGTLYSLFREVESEGLEQRSIVLSKDHRPDHRASTAFGLPPETPLFHLERIRYAGDEPLALDTVWLPADVGRHVEDVDFQRTALYDELERRAGIRMTGGREVISALVPDEDLTEVLSLDPGEACLRIERTAELDGRIIECRTTIIRGSRFALVSDWRATTAYAPHVALERRSEAG